MSDTLARGRRVKVTRRSVLRGGLMAVGGLLLPARVARAACPGHVCPVRQLTTDEPPYWYLCRQCAPGDFACSMPYPDEFVTDPCNTCPGCVSMGGGFRLPPIASKQMPVVGAPPGWINASAVGEGLYNENAYCVNGVAKLQPHSTELSLKDAAGTSLPGTVTSVYAGENFLFVDSSSGVEVTRPIRLFELKLDDGQPNPPVRIGYEIEMPSPAPTSKVFHHDVLAMHFHLVRHPTRNTLYHVLTKCDP